MRREKRWYLYSLSRWLIGNSIVVTLSAVVTLGILHLVSLHIGYDVMGKRLLLVVSFICTSLTVGTAAGWFNFHLNRCVSGLTRGLASVAEGDYAVRLDPKQAGPLWAAYEHFNKMGEELQSVQILREGFIDHFSHEFKTPIAAIQGFAELLKESDITAQEREQYLGIIVEESSRLAELTNSTLLLSRLESQTSVPNAKPFSLDEQIKRCAILLSHSWEEKGIVFSADLEPVEYVGNEELMRHVWINLLSNAIQHTPPGGEVSVTLKDGGHEVVVQVQDNGAGMSAEVQEHIFDKYYQGDPSHRSKGLGLGLSIVRQIVSLCGGEIVVRSEEGQGSTFAVHLPTC